MAFVPLFPGQVSAELAVVADAARGGALLVSPAREIVLARGHVTPEAAHKARVHAWDAGSSLDDPTSVFDDGSRLLCLRIGEGWGLAVQAEKYALLGTTFRRRLLRARDSLALLLAYMQIPLPGGRGSGPAGAPAEVFALPPLRRKN